METLRLRKIQMPSRLEQLLDSFVYDSKLVPESAVRTRDLGTLSRELRALVARADKSGRVWGCWAYGLDTWVFICEMSLPLSRERRSPVLQVDLYADDGLKDSGRWTSDGQGHWSRCGD